MIMMVKKNKIRVVAWEKIRIFYYDCQLLIITQYGGGDNYVSHQSYLDYPLVSLSSFIINTSKILH